MNLAVNITLVGIASVIGGLAVYLIHRDLILPRRDRRGHALETYQTWQDQKQRGSASAFDAWIDFAKATARLKPRDRRFLQRKIEFDFTNDSQLWLARYTEYVRGQYEALVAVSGDSSENFEALFSLIFSTRSSGNLKIVGLPELAYPEHWNEWLVRYREDPALHMFVGMPSEPDTSTIRLRAVKALLVTIDYDMVEVKYLLAVCNYRDRTREAIGHELINGLVRIVVADTNSRTANDSSEL